jgi:hypothetical protein
LWPLAKGGWRLGWGGGEAGGWWAAGGAGAGIAPERGETAEAPREGPAGGARAASCEEAKRGRPAWVQLMTGEPKAGAESGGGGLREARRRGVRVARWRAKVAEVVRPAERVNPRR